MTLDAIVNIVGAVSVLLLLLGLVFLGPILDRLGAKPLHRGKRRFR